MRVHIRVEFDMRAAVGAGDGAGLLHLLRGQLVGNRPFEIELGNDAAPRASIRHVLRVAAVIANQLRFLRVKAEISPALIAGKAVFGLSHQLNLY